MKKICLIYTGGTIGMVPTENGYAPQKGYFAEALAGISDLKAKGMPEWDLIEFDPLLDSSNITYVQWNQIAEAVQANYEKYDGFVILHGTDTMAYSASALSFMLENLSKPVVFTGSQIPLCEVRSDGRDNLITSMIIAADGIANEVTLFFDHHLLRGNRAIKMSADGLIAFQSPNFPILASAGIDIEYHKTLLRDVSGQGGESLKVRKIQPNRIIDIKLVPGMHSSDFAPLVTFGLDALILESFGTGNVPNMDESLPSLIAKATDAGVKVVVLTQCPQGTVRLGAYEVSSALASAGAISGLNMTTEACIAKLYYLLSGGEGQVTEDIRGELDHLQD